MKQLIFYCFVISLLVVNLITPLGAQNLLYEVEQITYKEGYPRTHCRNIAIDHLGQIWTSSLNQLIKYNGYSYEIYDFSNSNLNKGLIVGLYFEGGELYIFQDDKSIETTNGTSHTKVFLFDFETNAPTHYHEKYQNVNFEYLKYFSRRDNMILVLDQNDRVFDLLDKSHSAINTIPTYDFFYGFGKSKHVFLLQDQDLVIFDFAAKTTDTIFGNAQDKLGNHYFDQKGNLFIVSNSDFEFNSNDAEKFNIFKRSAYFRFRFENLEFRYNVLKKSKGRRDTLILDEFFNKNFNDFYDDLATPSIEIFDFKFGENGTIYAATNKGMLLLKLTNSKFKVFAQNETKTNSTRQILYSEDLLMYRDDSIEIIESPSGKFNTDFIEKRKKYFTTITYFQEEENKHLVWSTGWFNSKLRLIDFKNEVVYIANTDKVNDPTLFGILKSRYSNKIFTHSQNRLFYVDNLELKEDENWKKLTADSLIEITDIFYEKDKIWIGTFDGLFRYDESTGQIFRDPIFDKIPNVGISWVYFDKDNENIIWLGTKLEGLIKWNIKSNSLQQFTLSDGMKNMTIHSIYEDNNNRLWIPTNKYLHCIDKTTEEIFIFSEENGISNNEFNKYGFSENKDNSEIILASLNGYTIFNPDSISTNINEPLKINVLSGKVINENEKVDLSIETLKSEEIFINKDKSSLELEFGLDPIINSNLNEFYFKLNDSGENWNQMNGNKINLYTIPYGANTLEVKANLNHPNRISDLLTIRINVKRPFVKKNIFWYLMAFTFFLISWLFWVVRLNIIQKRNIRLEHEIQKRTKDLEEADTKRQKLFTIIAHDLRSPLISLTNITKKLRFLEKKNRMDEFYMLTQDTELRIKALNDNLSNILLWASKETNTIRPINLNLNLFDEISSLVKLYTDDASDKELDIINSVDQTLTVYFDKTVFQTILRNAIQNAIKYCSSGSTIQISSSSSERNTIIKVMNVYSEVNESEKVVSSGLGLQITEELAKLTNARFELIINDAGNTYFNFYIPKKEYLSVL